MAMIHSLRSLLPKILADPRVVVGWAALVLVIGIVLGIQPGWIAVLMFLPATLTGLQTIFRQLGKVVPAAAPAPPVAPAVLDLRMVRLQQIIHDLHHAASALTSLTDQPTGEQAAVITRATRTLEEFNAMADRSRREAVYLSVISRQTTSVTKSGQDALSAVTEGINTIQARVNDVAQLLTTLAHHLRRISQINATVSEIATQSNFLALNAAIEAARAGEQGRSFATVADEIRALSDQARTAVTQIRELLMQIQRAMEEVVNATEQQAQSVESGAATMQQAHEAINKLSTSLSESTGTVQKIIAAIDHQSNSIEGLVTSINNVGQITLQSQAGLRIAQNVARDLNGLANELNELSSGAPIHAA